jgi:hypothetical protein
MKVLITENQYRTILLESSKNSLNSVLEDLKEFATMVIEKTQQDVGVNLKMLLIWGAGVGGVMAPLNEFIQNGDFNLNDFQIASILCATTAILYGESKSVINELLNVIKDEGIVDEFNRVLSKGAKLKKVFLNFIQSLNMTLSSVTNIMSYAFIIPILPILWDMSQTGVTKPEVKEIVIRLMSFGLTAISGNTLRELVTKLVNRFRD